MILIPSCNDNLSPGEKKIQMELKIKYLQKIRFENYETPKSDLCAAYLISYLPHDQILPIPSATHKLE